MKDQNLMVLTATFCLLHNRPLSLNVLLLPADDFYVAYADTEAVGVCRIFWEQGKLES